MAGVSFKDFVFDVRCHAAPGGAGYQQARASPVQQFDEGCESPPASSTPTVVAAVASSLLIRSGRTLPVVKSAPAGQAHSLSLVVASPSVESGAECGDRYQFRRIEATEGGGSSASCAELRMYVVLEAVSRQPAERCQPWASPRCAGLSLVRHGV